MEDTQILSTLHGLEPEQQTQSKASAGFDACQMGVVLRAVLFVEVAIGVVVLFDGQGFWNWLSRFSLVTGGALPAVLSWLLLTCLAKHWLARLPLLLQGVLPAMLGGLMGVSACGLLFWTGLLSNPPWLASALSGLLQATTWKPSAASP